MRILSIIQPSEMGPDFRFEDDVWKVNFPAGSEGGGGVPLSTDANNAIGLGTDQGAFISTDLLGAYALTQDNGSKKINLYRFQPGTEFNPETATLVSSVNMIELSGIFDDVAIDGDLITFTDADTGLTLTLDTANLKKVSDIIGSDSVEVNSLDGLTTLSVKINPHPDNLIEVTEEGLLVDAANFSGVGELDLHQTLAQVEEGLCHVVGNSHLVVPQIELTDVAGRPIGYINNLIGLPAFSTTEGSDHCPKWEAPTAGNCRIGKIAVSLVEDLLYEIVEEGQEVGTSIKWRIFINGVDTKYNASSRRGIGGPIAISPEGGEIGGPIAISPDGYPEDDVMGSGYLGEIISQASNGVVNGDHNDRLILWNNTNSQVIITLVPSMPITVNDMNNAFGGDGIKIYGMNEEQLGTIKDKLPVSEAFEPPTVENLEDYFSDVDGGALTICLAPNPNGNGGSTGPQISCAGATDRFATSSLWYNWTVKLNGKTLIENARSDDVIQALDSKGIRVGYEGEMRTTYRNLTNENIRLEFIAGIPNNQWDRIYLELHTATNPTLMGYDPIQNNAELERMAFFPPEEDSAPVQYQRLTVCLAPADDRMGWDYKDIDTSTAVITLRNSVNLIGVNQGFQIEGEHNLELETGVDVWGDLTWTIGANSPQRREVILTIDHPDHQDEFTVDFFARKPMVVTLANTNEYAKTVNVASYIAGNTIDIVSVEVAAANGFTTVTELDDGLVIDLKVGSLRIDNLAEGMFSYILQGRFVGIELIETVKVKFVTETGAEEIAEVELNADNFEGEFIIIPESTYKKVTIGVVDPNHYTNLNDLPAINLEIPEGASTVMKRINGLGAEDTLEINFKEPGDTHQLYIKAYLNGAQLAVLGSCVVGVDDWGDLEAGGYTFNQETYAKRFDQDLGLDSITVSKNNLSYVPKEGPINLRNMVGMFAGTDLSDPSVDLSGYDVGGVYSMVGVFAHSNFNGNILSWNMRWVGNLDYAFYASKFRQDLSLWCVSSIRQEPKLFSHRAPLLAKHKPVWGTCPIPGSDTTVLRHYVEEGDLSEDAGLGSYTLVARGIKPADVTVRLDGQRITNLYSDRDYFTGMETVVFQVRTTRDSEGLLEIKHPPLSVFKVDNINSSRPKHVDVVKFGKNVEGFELTLPFAFKVPSSIPSTVLRLNRMFDQSNEFADAENVEKWDVGNVLWMENTFTNCANLNADLRNWCTTKIITTPLGFAENSGILPENLPVWGTCPMGSPYIDSGVEPLTHRVTADSFITTEPMPLLTGRVSHPAAILKVYDENAIKYTPAVNHGDGTWSCQLDYIKAPTQHRLTAEVSNSITNEKSDTALMWVVLAEIEGGYYDRATSELVCTSPEGLYLRTVNGGNTRFNLANFQTVDGLLKDVTFCVTETSRTLADFKASGPLLGDARVEPLEGSDTMYMGGKGDSSYWTFEPMVDSNLQFEVQENNLASHLGARGWRYTQHNTVGLNKAIFIHLKPVAGEEETRIKFTGVTD